MTLVADSAPIGVDIRTVPGMDHAALLTELEKTIGDTELDVFSNLQAVWTEPDQAWMRRVFEVCAEQLGTAPAVQAAAYMTDAANLRKLWAGAPTVVLGPGEPQQAHQTDEYCSMEKIRQAVALYEALIRDWTLSA